MQFQLPLLPRRKKESTYFRTPTATLLPCYLLATKHTYLYQGEFQTGYRSNDDLVKGAATTYGVVKLWLGRHAGRQLRSSTASTPEPIRLNVVVTKQVSVPHGNVTQTVERKSDHYAN
jgi:hypothetical protein